MLFGYLAFYARRAASLSYEFISSFSEFCAKVVHLSASEFVSNLMMTIKESQDPDNKVKGLNRLVYLGEMSLTDVGKEYFKWEDFKFEPELLHGNFEGLP